MDSHGDQSSRTLAEQGTLDLAGVPIALLGDEEGRGWVAMERLCGILALEWEEEHAELQANPVWSEELVRAWVLHVEGEGEEEVLCLPLAYVRGWLFALNARKVKPVGLREAVERYQLSLTGAMNGR